MVRISSAIRFSGEKGIDTRSCFSRATALVVFIFFLAGANLSCEKEGSSSSKSRENRLPVIISAQIFPEKPNAESQLNVVIQGKDPDGDPVTYDYVWMKNDAEIAGAKTSILASGNFRKGDFISIKVTPSDGKADGKPFLSPSVKILNSPPVIQKVWIEPNVAHTTDELKVRVESFDRDGDSVYFMYKWEKNGVVLSEVSGDTLEQGEVKKGDSVVVVVTPDDRAVLGEPRKSSPVVIVNSPPLILSSPPPSLKGNIYLYPVKAEDPDKDPVTFTLRAGPKGMELNPTTGLLRWEIRKEDEGTHGIEIEASDPEGAKSLQQYTLSVKFK
jgi:hypothetical protein